MKSKRQFMYLSKGDDAALLLKLSCCTAKGSKSDLMRSYAMKGLQRTLELCTNAKGEGEAALVQLLAELFAPPHAPPDLRMAADFIKAYKIVRDRGKTARVAPEDAPPKSAKLTDEVKHVEDSKPPQQWSNLKNLVGGQSKSQDQGAK